MATIVSKSTASRTIEVLRSRPGVRVAGGDWMELTGASLISYNAGTRSVTQTPTFRGPGVSVGSKSIEGVTYDLAAVQPHLKVMGELDRADQQRLPVSVRHDFYGHEILATTTDSENKISIAAPGSGASGKGGRVKFAGTKNEDVRNMFLNDEVLVGDLFVINNATYIVNYVEYDSDAPKALMEDGDTTKPLPRVYVTNADGSDANVIAEPNAASFSLRVAGLRVEFGGQVEQFGSINGDASGSPSLASGVVFRPNSSLARPSLLLTDESGSGW